MATTKLIVCTNFRPFSGQPSCAYRGSEALLAYLTAEIEQRELNVTVQRGICLGHCPRGPNVKVIGGAFLHEANEAKLRDLLDSLAPSD